MAAAAAELLWSKIECKDAEESRIVLPTKLIERKTVQYI